MIVRARAPGKVNLSLFVGGTRSDGKHELVTLFESVSLSDELSMTVAEGSADEVICPGVEGPNLALQALRRLRERGWGAPPVSVQIEKRIPVAGGMGGGSADAAAVLRMAIELAPGRPEEVAEIAASLGADVPSQLAPGLVLGTGSGEIVEAMPPLAPHGLMIVPQAGRLSTTEVYRQADRLGLPRDPKELAARQQHLRAALGPGARLPSDLVVNDLEAAAVALAPEIFEALEAIRAAGADEVLVCGSGPTSAGVYWGQDGSARATRSAADLAGRFPGTLSVLPIAPESALPQRPRLLPR